MNDMWRIAKKVGLIRFLSIYKSINKIKTLKHDIVNSDISWRSEYDKKQTLTVPQSLATFLSPEKGPLISPVTWFVRWLVVFYSISTLAAYLMPNPVHTYISDMPVGYRRRKSTRRHEFKSWTRLIAFHIALIPLGKVWIQLFPLQLWVNSRTDCVLQPWGSN